MTYAKITGWGKCVPPAVLTNDDLSKFVDTSDEWILSRTGIQERRITHVELSELATLAAKRALAAAGLEGSDLDLIILATASGDSLIPNTASAVQRNIGACNAAAFDQNAACSGFLYGLQMGTAMIKSGVNRRVLVIGADRLNYYINWADRASAVLFGDGAGAVILEASDDACGLLAAKLGCDPERRDILEVQGPGTYVDRFHTSACYNIAFEGPEIFKRAINGMNSACQTALSDAGMSGSDIDVIIPHQANLRIIQTLAKKMGVGMEKVMVNIHKYGNTSAASVAIALCEAVEEGRIQAGSNILSAAFGAGLTYAGVVIKWGDRVTPIRTIDDELPPCDKSASELVSSAVEGCLQATAEGTVNFARSPKL
ncbi:3-oxoacyl-[acyl-carrier-protein] synthase-3 [Sinobacterium caligoides]|uniref:Beta-ketoacyl-[acyl-carrier-protein] synthase III n=2 Tax=Sinobacterium caligoides TaxID=933926 RepID=A0A3N2DI46_9GAMM|nr:3-oxoacyl-[acyl-carrier-protein] synthase-3 [Sinobacterium caligoides]